MTKGRLEAFSDGVIAILITIMVLELKVPHGTNLASLEPTIPIFVSYVLSFINIGIYWNNHHHLMQIVSRINGGVLWANLHLLFWLSLIPFCTSWINENYLSPLPVAAYAFVLLMAGTAYYVLVKLLLKVKGQNEKLAVAIGKDKKGIISVILYFIAIPTAFINTWVGIALIVAVAIIWLLPDRRIEKLVEKEAAD